MKSVITKFVFVLILTQLWLSISIGSEIPLASSFQTAAPVNLQEQIDLRTENTRTYLNTNGIKTVFLSGAPLHYRERNGRFQSIETRLVSRNSRSEFAAIATRNTIKAYFGHTAAQGIRLENGDDFLEFAPLHSRPSPAIVRANRVTYHRVSPGIDLSYTILPGRIKEELILHSTPKDGIFQFRVNAPGLTLQSLDDGTTIFRSVDGQEAFRILPSFMYEQANPNREGKVGTSFHIQDGQLYCDLQMDMEWLRAPGRKYPVVVDPTVVTFTSGQPFYSIKFLLSCPDTYSSITCRLKSTASSLNYNYFKDITTGQVYISDKKNGFDKTYTTTLVAGHNYEVRAYYGVTATITYGDTNGNLFADMVNKNEFLTAIVNDMNTDNTFNISKTIELKCAQRIDYNFIKEPASENGHLYLNPYFRITKEGDTTLLVNLESENTGYIDLAPGKYTISLRPKARENSLNPRWYHYRAELNFSERTAGYEKEIIIGTNPGYIISKVRIPQNGSLFWQYQMKTGSFYAVINSPSIELWQDTNMSLQKVLDVNNYVMIHGGIAANVQKDVDYKVKITRGLYSNIYTYSSCGSMYVRTILPKAALPEITLVDSAGQAISNGHAKNDATFRYSNTDGRGPKQGKVIVQKVGSSQKKEFPLSAQQLANNAVLLPYRLQDFSYQSGDQLTCTFEVWDGFELTTKSLTFYYDDTPPVVRELSGIVQNNNLAVTYRLADVRQSFLQNAILSWKVNGQATGSAPLDLNVTTYNIPNLPPNAPVELTLTVTDWVGLQSTQTITVANYPGAGDIPGATVVPGGTLAVNQEWNGNILISGDLIVPHGVTLQLNAGTKVYFAGNYSIRVLGRIIINGTATNKVTLGDAAVWNGLRIESGDAGSSIQQAIIQRASAGLVISGTQLTVSDSTIIYNNYGIHIIGCSPTIQNCVFQENLLYGVKEDNGAAPTVIGCRFVQNPHADYYEDSKAVITIEALNQIGSNHDNVKE
jgi:hypothetical protein